MPELERLGLKLVDATTLGDDLRAALRPDELLEDEAGRPRRLPRYFYEVGSKKKAEDVELAPGFHLIEFLRTDVREAEPLRGWPRYVPCAVVHLTAALAVFRQRVDTYVHVAANGGYRSPGHALTRHASPHCWGTAANLYRVGDDLLDSEETIERYAEIVRDVLPGAWVRPYGHAPGLADDHLHLDLGYTLAVPHDAPGEPA